MYIKNENIGDIYSVKKMDFFEIKIKIKMLVALLCLPLPKVERLLPVLSKIGKDLRPFVGSEDRTIDL